MIVAVASLLFASLLFWFGLVRAHWIAPAVLFTASGPVIAAFSLDYDVIQVAGSLLMNLLLFLRRVRLQSLGSRLQRGQPPEASSHLDGASEHVQREGRSPLIASQKNAGACCGLATAISCSFSARPTER